MAQDPAVQRDLVAEALAGLRAYDTLGGPDQAAVRAAWAESLTADLDALDLRRRFNDEGRTRWSELDSTGRVVVHHTATERPDGPAGDGVRDAGRSGPLP